MFSIRPDWQRFPSEWAGPSINMFWHKEMNFNEERASLPDHFNKMTNIKEMFSDPKFSI